MSSTNMLYAFERDGAFVRTTAANEIQVVRDGEAVLAVPFHPNYQVSASPAGPVVFTDGALQRLDLAKRSPAPTPARSALADLGSVAVHPDGTRLLAYDTDANTLSWVAWNGKRTKVVTLRDPELVAYPEVALAADGATWALLDTEDVVLGRGGRRIAFVGLGDLTIDIWPRTYAFDLDHDRLVLSGAPGLVVLSLRDGSRTTAAEGRDFVSPVVAWDGASVAVARVDEAYEVVRLDRETLEPTGVVDELGRWADPDGAFALLAPADGSLVVVPATKPLRVLAAEGSDHRAGPLVELVGAARVEAVPAPTARWYREAIGTTGVLPGTEGGSPVGPAARIDRATAGERRSLARFLLDQLADPTRLGALLRRDPGAFTPYASTVVRWDDTRLAMARSMLPDSWWRLAPGADDAATDELADRVRAARDSSTRDLLFELLCGVDTERALEHVATIARPRAGRPLRTLAGQRGLLVPAEGAAVRRFAEPGRDIVGRRGRRGRSPAGLAWLPAGPDRGVDCAAPPLGVLSVALDLLPGGGFPGTHHFLQSDCERCDEADAGYVVEAAPAGQPELVGSLEGGKLRPVRARPSCAGEPGGRGIDHGPLRVVLEPQQASFRFDDVMLGQLGGRPRWVQQPEVPTCPRCRVLAFFVGQVDDTATGGSTLFGFHCEHCALGIQIVQDT